MGQGQGGHSHEPSEFGDGITESVAREREAGKKRAQWTVPVGGASAAQQVRPTLCRRRGDVTRPRREAPCLRKSGN